MTPTTRRQGRTVAAGSDLSRVIGKGVYGASDALSLANFQRDDEAIRSRINRSTLSRWLKGYAFESDGVSGYSPPLWLPDFANDDEVLELSFRDLIEVRFVRAFRELGLSLQAIRECFARAVEEVNDPRPFSTRRFRTDGKTIFLDVTNKIGGSDLVDLRRRQSVFRAIVAPSLKDLEFDADIVARWFPLGRSKGIVVDPSRSFGRAIDASSGVAAEVLATAAVVEGSPERAAAAYEVPLSAVRAAIAFQQRLAA